METKEKIRELVKQYYTENFSKKSFVPNESRVPISGMFYDEKEILSLIDASLEFWITSGHFTEEFEKEFSKFMNVLYALFVNSGSSANLLALSCLTSSSLGEKRLKRGDEVITLACGFPTTVNPIVQNGLIPVFVDVTLPTYNINCEQLESALSSKTKAVMIAHTLGNPFNLDVVTRFCKENNLWLIEDCCDAYGSKYNGEMVGTFGDLATTSFFPAHLSSCGEGGCVLTNDPKLRKLVETFRDWGRGGCWCLPGHDNTCKKRYDWQLGNLPYGYDHKYIYEEIGYNLKSTELQASIMLEQVKKLPFFIEKRKENFKYLYDGFKDLSNYFILPEATEKSDPVWFGFPLTIRPESKINRRDLILDMDSHKVESRLIFAGNIIRQPAYQNVEYRTIGNLVNSDLVMNNSFWIGTFPGLTKEMLDFEIETIHNFFKDK
jgi:CDP-6-deoxy-D-xylo-4-hexulose-3-dehydrase